MIYHYFPALNRYCPSNLGPCDNHMTLYINLKQQEDKGVIYTRGRDGERHNNQGVQKQDTGTLQVKDDPAPPSMPDINKANGIMGYMGQTTKKTSAWFSHSHHLLLSQEERGAGFYPRMMNDHRSQFLPVHHLSVTWRQTITRLATKTPGAAIDREVWAESRMLGQ